MKAKQALVDSLSFAFAVFSSVFAVILCFVLVGQIDLTPTNFLILFALLFDSLVFLFTLWMTSNIQEAESFVAWEKLKISDRLIRVETAFWSKSDWLFADRVAYYLYQEPAVVLSSEDVHVQSIINTVTKLHNEGHLDDLIEE